MISPELWTSKVVLFKKETKNGRAVYFKARPRGTKISKQVRITREHYFTLLDTLRAEGVTIYM